MQTVTVESIEWKSKVSAAHVKWTSLHQIFLIKSSNVGCRRMLRKSQ